jgi:hypothetical protein
MRKLLVTIAAMLAIVVLSAISIDAGWDSHGDSTARSLPGSDHATAAGLADVTVESNEERSRGRDTVGP